MVNILIIIIPWVKQISKIARYTIPCLDYDGGKGVVI